MADKSKEDRRSSVGFGSTYRKGKGQDLGSHQEIGSVVGGQVWLVKPDKKAKASNPCLWMQAGVVKFKNCDNYYDCTSCNGIENSQGQATDLAGRHEKTAGHGPGLPPQPDQSY
jgi:hypothetical protein